MAFAAHTDETRAAVIAAVHQGESVKSVSRKFGIGAATVRRWRDAAGVATFVPQKGPDLGVLVARYLAAGLEALEAQARLFGDADWAKRQPAGELAVLHGVLADKLIRVLAALESTNDGDGATAIPGASA